MLQDRFETVIQEIHRKKYVRFNEGICEQMQRLLTGRYTNSEIQMDVPRRLISPKEVMQVRLSKLEDEKREMQDSYIYTNLAMIPHEKIWDIKCIPDHPFIKTINQKMQLEKSAILVSEDQYLQYDGFVFTNTEVRELRRDPQALENRRREFWEFMAEGDLTLLHAYEQEVCNQLHTDFQHAMGVYTPAYPGLRLLCFAKIQSSEKSGVGANPDGHVLFDCGVLCGVAEREYNGSVGTQPSELEKILKITARFINQDQRKEFERAISSFRK